VSKREWARGPACQYEKPEHDSSSTKIVALRAVDLAWVCRTAIGLTVTRLTKKKPRRAWQGQVPVPKDIRLA